MGRVTDIIGRGILWAVFSTRQGRSTRGVSLVELLIAMAILALVIMVPLLTVAGHEKRMVAVDDGGIAWQLVANEAELQRHRPYSELRHGASEPFLTLADGSPFTELAGGLESPVGRIRVVEEIGGVARVHIRLQWGNEQRRREAAITILRSDLPGGTLW